MSIRRNLKFYATIAVLVTGVCATLYPIAIYPMTNPEYFKEIQKQTRAGIKQEDVQPGNMKVWTDPFDRPKAK